MGCPKCPKRAKVIRVIDEDNVLVRMEDGTERTVKIDKKGIMGE